MDAEIEHLVRNDFLSVQKDESISSFIGKLKAANQRSALIFDHNKFLGVVEDKRLLKTKLDATEMKVSRLIKRIPVSLPEISLVDAAYLMFQSDNMFLPIAANKQVMGVIWGLDLIKETANRGLLKDFGINQFRIEKVPELKTDDFTATALAHMRQKNVWQLPVCEEGRCVGVLSYRDILKKYLPFPAEGGRSFKNVDTRTKAFEAETPEIDKLPVSSFDTHHYLHTITRKEKFEKAAELMHKNDVTSLIVVDGAEFIGMLTLKNIMRKIASLKIPDNFNIYFIGLEETGLGVRQRQNIKKIASIESAKIQREIKNQFNLVIHIKEYEVSGKGDKKRKYSVNIRLNYPGRIIQSHRGRKGAWVIETALKKAFDNIQNELKKKFRGDSSRRKEYE